MITVFINAFLVVTSAALTGVAYYDYSYAFIVWFSLAPFLYVILQTRTTRSALLYSALFGLVLYGLIFNWITVVTTWVGPIGYLGWAGVVVYLTLLMMINGVVLHFFRSDAWTRLFVPPFVWVIFEWAQSKGAFGITASSLAYVHKAEWRVSQVAAIGGYLLLTLLIVITNTWLANLFLASGEGKRERRALLIAAGLLIVVAISLFVYSDKEKDGYLNAEQTEVIRVLIYQPNVPQYKKVTYDYLPELRQLLLSDRKIIEEHVADLYVFPESVIPGVFIQNQHIYAQLASAIPTGSGVIVGSNHKRDGKYYNSLFLLGRDGSTINRYDKMKLVPFGEYTPFRLLLDPILPASMQFLDLSCSDKPVVFKVGDYRVGVAVCFESIFPELFYQYHQQGCQIYSVSTNDGWFMNTPALKFHHNATAFRAVESRKPVLFAANTGVSAVFSPSGAALRELGYDTRGTITQSVSLHAYVSPYYRWYGLIIVVSWIIIAAFFVRKWVLER